jgi:uncharacterized membrane protein YccF (DUF307 family)
MFYDFSSTNFTDFVLADFDSTKENAETTEKNFLYFFLSGFIVATDSLIASFLLSFAIIINVDVVNMAVCVWVICRLGLFGIFIIIFCPRIFTDFVLADFDSTKENAETTEKNFLYFFLSGLLLPRIH